jgi:hypothetical protein
MLKREKQETKLEKDTTLPIPLGKAATGHYEARFYLLLITTERLKSLWNFGSLKMDQSLSK